MYLFVVLKIQIVTEFGKIQKTHPPRCPKNLFLEVFCMNLVFFHLISNRLNGVYINSLTQIVALLYKFLFSIFTGFHPSTF